MDIVKQEGRSVFGGVLETNADGVLVMDSREIAELTEKGHSNVCRDIRNQLEAQGIGEFNFESSYLSEQNKRVRCYKLDY